MRDGHMATKPEKAASPNGGTRDPERAARIEAVKKDLGDQGIEFA